MLLVDGPNFAWRSHFAGPELSSKGRPTGVLHIGLGMLASFKDLFKQQGLIFLWDGPVSWRQRIFSEYKGNRDKKAVDRKAVHIQIAVFKKVLTKIGIMQIQEETLEADDLAAILTEYMITHHEPVTLISSDKDWFSLLQPGVTQVRKWSGKKKEEWTHDRVLEKFKVRVQDWPRYLALTGDKIDNIPQVRKKMGPVAARKVIAGEIKLTADETKLYHRNLQLTQLGHRSVLDDAQWSVITGRAMIKPVRDSKIGWAYLENILNEYELYQLWTERRALWEVGGWGWSWEDWENGRLEIARTP